MDINEFIQKVPRPPLVIGVLIIAIIFFVINDPLRDECEVQTSIFNKKTLGLLNAVRTKSKKIQFPKIEYWKNRCKEGNSIGSCNDYFDGLRLVSKELHGVSDNCQVKYSTENENFTKQIAQALQIMALVAWGEKPPAGISERLGWLNEANIRTFCYLKKTFILMGGEESFQALRGKVYREFPGEWSEKDVNKLVQSGAEKNKTENNDLDVAQLVAESRPRAYDGLGKSLNNIPTEARNKEIERKLYELSIFSIRCDLYM